MRVVLYRVPWRDGHLLTRSHDPRYDWQGAPPPLTDTFRVHLAHMTVTHRCLVANFPVTVKSSCAVQHRRYKTPRYIWCSNRASVQPSIVTFRGSSGLSSFTLTTTVLKSVLHYDDLKSQDLEILWAVFAFFKNDPFQTVASARIAPKICQSHCSPNNWLTLFQISSKSLHFRRSYCRTARMKTVLPRRLFSYICSSL